MTNDLNPKQNNTSTVVARREDEIEPISSDGRSNLVSQKYKGVYGFSAAFGDDTSEAPLRTIIANLLHHQLLIYLLNLLLERLQ